MWFYKGEEFTSEMIEDWIGFVYLITDKSNGMKYVGKNCLLQYESSRRSKETKEEGL